MADDQSKPANASPEAAAPPAEVQKNEALEALMRTPFVAAVVKPIPGDNPCGKDVSYDDDFQRVKAEIDRIGTVSAKVDQKRVADDAREFERMREMASGRDRAAAEAAMKDRSTLTESTGPDYRLVAELGTRILGEKSKDLRVACYVTRALWRTKKFEGVAEGLMGIQVLIRDYWEGLYPSKARATGRKGAIEFLAQPLTEAMKGAEIQAEDHPHLELAKSVAEGLEKEVSAKMPDIGSLALALAKQVDECLMKVPRPAAAPAPGAQPPGAPSAAGVASAAPPADMHSSQDAVDAVRKAAAYLRAQDKKNAAAYRILRSIRWDALAAEPPHEGAKTRLEAPSAQRRSFFATLRESGQWEKLVDEGEAAFGQPPFHFWFDLQSYVVGALGNLGSEFESARMAILQELAGLLHRLPALSTLTFSDGTPFASPAAQGWIEETVLPLSASGASPASGVSSGGKADQLQGVFEDAKKTLGKGDLAGAVAALHGFSSADRSRRSEFQRRLYISMLCIRANQIPLARPLLEELDQEITKFALHEWEPELALEVWTNLKKCCDSLSSGASGASKQTYLDQATQAFERICKLDVSYALAMAGVRKTKSATPARAAAAKDSVTPQAGEQTPPSEEKQPPAPAAP
jgi:type VI secretion system protein VasJ